MRRTRTGLHAIAAIWLAACGGPDATATSTSTQAQANAVAQPAPAPLPADATPEQAVAYNGKRYAAGFSAEGAVIKGTLAQGGRGDHLLVLKAGRCYRIVGAAEQTVADMDLFLYDPNGVQTHQDPSQDRFPVLGLQGEICPVQSGAYRVQAHMYEGAGAYAIGLFRTP